MRWSLFLILAILSCAHHDGLERTPSSEAESYHYGEPDEIQSSVKEFPPEHRNQTIRHIFFVELRDQASSLIDRDIAEFRVYFRGKVYPAEVSRVLRGRYYVIVESPDKSTGDLDFRVSGIKLRESFKLRLNYPDEKNSRVRTLKKGRHRAVLELSLRDKFGKAVELREPPEVLAEDDSDIVIEKVEPMGKGIWQVQLQYPRGNQLTYLSVRSRGLFFKKLFRFQYVDK